MTTAMPAPGGRLYDHEKLRQWRREAGLSREEVWLSVGVSVAWLRDLELGHARNAPSLDLLVRLAKFYGHDPSELLQVPA